MYEYASECNSWALWISWVHYAVQLAPVTPPASQVSSPLTSGHVKCNYNFLSWVTLFSTLIALINLMYLVADSDWGSLLGVLFLAVSDDRICAWSSGCNDLCLSLWRHDTSPARRSRPIIKIFLSVYSWRVVELFPARLSSSNALLWYRCRSRQVESRIEGVIGQDFSKSLWATFK